jgi:hypothetical protein
MGMTCMKQCIWQKRVNSLLGFQKSNKYICINNPDLKG